MEQTLRILHLEDDRRDADMVRDVLEAGGIACDIELVQTRGEFVAALDRGGFDLIFADCSLPSFDGVSALRIAVERTPNIPFIVVSGNLGEEMAIEVLKLGATDYVLKERMSRMVSAVRGALREAEHRIEREQHLWFLESMDRFNRAMQRTNDLQQMMSDVLDEVREIFCCDRAWLVYPCDPKAATWRVVMEHTTPHFPGAFAVDGGLPVDPGVSGLFERALSTKGALQLEPQSDLSLPKELVERFSIRSMMAMAVRPKTERAYLFGLHQCSHARSWTDGERRLFEEIGQRLADGLTSMSAHRDLLASEAKLEEAQRIAHLGHWERNYETGRMTFSSELSKIYGLGSHEVVGDMEDMHEQWLGVMHREDRERVTQIFAAALQTGAYDTEYRVVYPNGDVRTLHSRGVVTRSKTGEVVRAFGMSQDITWQRRAEEAVRASEQRYRTLFENANDAIFLENERGEIIELNQRACTLLGNSREELLAMKVANLQSPELRHQAGRVIRNELADYGNASFDAIALHRDGRRIPVEVTNSEILDGDQKLVLSIVRDVTERKRGEEERERLRRLEADLAHMSRAITMGELTGSIAHEVNQPLGAMVANAAACERWLAAKPPGTSKAREALKSIIADGQRASAIIGRIRTLMKRQPPQKESVDINAAIREVLALAEQKLRGNEVMLRLTERLPLVEGDKVQLQQVLLNLIVNAIEAMSGIANRRRKLTIVSQKDRANVVVEVRDSGAGLDLERSERLFEAFYTTKEEGMGIGLAISRSIVEAHGGRMWAGPNAPHGAVFRFSLPVAGEAVS